MARRVVFGALWVGAFAACGAFAGDAVYVAHDPDSVPRFSSQAYDAGYSLLLGHAHVLPSPPEKPGRVRSAVVGRQAAALPLIAQAAQRYGIDPALVAAVADVESGFNARAVSPKGAIGAMQLIPTTAADYLVTDPYDLRQNLEGGTRYLKDLLTAHNGNLPLALAAYNAGKSQVVRHHQRIPPFDETMLYVPRVLAKMAEYRHRKELQHQ